MANKNSSPEIEKSMSVISAEDIRVQEQHAEVIPPVQIPVEPQVTEEENALPMERKDGVNYVWIEVNGIPLKFIFDTGASSIFISPAEALVLVKQGTLEESDIIGTENYQDATGGISEGTVINLKEVKMGNKILKNIKASVSDNIQSPLLLGQSALEQFGSIEIDNKNARIILR
ncbi:retropepsin-like aspartic protease family protein [Kaistella sp.]|uniref:retropepsin-like aspartic protease family protein n=1 Tax=Kaistella sp. TaxID=2782235 RepID=UPI002F94954E